VPGTTPRPTRWLAASLAIGLAVLSADTPQGRADPPPPNILIVIADDMGFSDLGCYGSEIPTPSIDALASRSIVFSNFHVAPTCSPTRATLLTGVDHHRAGMGNMYEFLIAAPAQIGRPGYEGSLNESVVTLAEVLKTAGYFTAISGKWHLGGRLTTAEAPVGRGFDRSWVLWSGWAEHFSPAYSRGFVAGQYRVAYPDGRYSTEWYTDKAIEFADEAINQKKPFLLLASYTAPHWPLEAPADLIAKQKGRYDQGYERLRQRRIAGLIQNGILPAGIPAAPSPKLYPPLHHTIPVMETESWNELSDAQRTYSARLMEIHAAMIESLDQQVGRLLEHLNRRRQLDNTLVIFLSDNGASSLSTETAFPGNELENLGRPGSFAAFGPQWAQASSGPLRLMKGYPTEGGTRVAAIVKLPNSGQHRVTHAFASAADIAPTIYELVGVDYPERFRDHDILPLDGKSMLAHLVDTSDRIHSADEAIGWELFGRAALRRGNWKITWIEKPFGSSEFELFDLQADPGETRNLRHEHPEIYQQLVKDFQAYARKNGVVIVRPDHWLDW
jgi:arylsulfatase